MQRRTNHIIIEYNNPSEEVYLDKLLEILDNKYLELKKFFDGLELKKDIVFVIWDNLEEFKKMCINKYGHYREGTVGKANKDNIDILTYAERIKIEQRRNDPIEYYFMTFSHEMVHRFHIEYKENSKGNWFAEGLACFLGSPRYDEIIIDCSPEDFINAKLSYKYYYTLVKFMIDNYDHDKILEYARDDNLLIKDTKNILCDYLEKNNTKSIKK